MTSLDPLLQRTEHRPYPVPYHPFVMRQTWSDLLFAHWPISKDLMKRAVPNGLEIDTYDGFAWLGIVPFKMRNVRHRLLPAVPGLSNFLEINVRTYVTVGGYPGVYFLSLDASNPLAVHMARIWYQLPYFTARMGCSRNGDEFNYYSARADDQAPAAQFRGRYRPVGDVFLAQRGSLEEFLTERYCLYVVDSDGQIFRGDVHHQPWPLQMAEAEIAVNTMVEFFEFDLSKSDPILHFARDLETIEWSIRQVG